MKRILGEGLGERRAAKENGFVIFVQWTSEQCGIGSKK
jgi:hypothetical protein